jgi:hypothetical protein
VASVPRALRKDLPVTIDDLVPYLGLPCSIRLRCRGCGAAHVHSGRPRQGRHLGDFMLKGYTFSIEDIEQIWRHQPPRRPRLFLSRLHSVSSFWRDRRSRQAAKRQEAT